MPSQRGALDPDGKLRHSRKYRQLADCVFRSAVPSHQIVKLGEKFLRFARALTFQTLRHHRSRSLGDGAARALKADVVNGTVFHVHVNGKVVAAKRVEAFRLMVRGIQRLGVTRMLAVLQNDFLIKLPQFRHGYPSTSTTL